MAEKIFFQRRLDGQDKSFFAGFLFPDNRIYPLLPLLRILRASPVEQDKKMEVYTGY